MSKKYIRVVAVWHPAKNLHHWSQLSFVMTSVMITTLLVLQAAAIKRTLMLLCYSFTREVSNEIKIGTCTHTKQWFVAGDIREESAPSMSCFQPPSLLVAPSIQQVAIDCSIRIHPWWLTDHSSNRTNSTNAWDWGITRSCWGITIPSRLFLVLFDTI